MGTYYSLDERSIQIKPENVPAAIAALRKAVAKWAAYQRENYPEYPGYPERLEAILQEQDDAAFLKLVVNEGGGWYVSIDPSDGIKDPWIEERKGGIDTDWLEAMSPFIESGGYVQIKSDNDDLPWRDVWKNGKESVRIFPVWPEI